MNGSDSFSIVVGIAGFITGIVSLGFAVWVWLRSDTKIRELSNVIGGVHNIASGALWEENISLNESPETMLKQAVEMKAHMADIERTTEKYAGKKHKYSSSLQLDLAIEHGILLTASMIGEFEMRQNIKEIWLTTPDLKPDSSDPATGKMVSKCIKDGKKYKFFYPDNLKDKDGEIAKLLTNIGMSDPKSKTYSNIDFVPLDANEFGHLFRRGNNVLFYSDEKRRFPLKCFEEVVFRHVPERGLFWQEHSEQTANELKQSLELGLKSITSQQINSGGL
ncbi:MAG: hypothetical protein JRN22_00705 [Nitrososphaerota archaeon]|nr:hypothetical protein [Nitrososphaerota archaeon]